jgi:hypothetical protein
LVTAYGRYGQRHILKIFFTTLRRDNDFAQGCAVLCSFVLRISGRRDEKAGSGNRDSGA